MRTFRLASVDSTNEEARHLADAGETGPIWIIAHEQTGGRGRRGRPWVSPPGNLFATLLLAPSGPLERRAQLSFVAALAVADTVAAYAGPVTLKWPNDVLLEARKVAGILLESFGAALAVGLGINLAHFPPDAETPATSVAYVVGQTPAPDDAFHRLAGHWGAWYDAWASKGFAPVREAWLARAAGLGEPIRVRLMDREMNGVFEDLDEDGALLLRQPDGLARVTAGDVFFGRGDA